MGNTSIVWVSVGFGYILHSGLGATCIVYRSIRVDEKSRITNESFADSW